MATEGTKLQVNLKTPGGTLVNVYAATTDELDYGLDLIGKRSQSILDLERLLSGASVVVNAGMTTTLSQPVEPAVSVTSPPAAGAPTCKHGPMQYRESKPDAAKKWRAYFCPTPKGTPDQCEPQWIKG